MTKKKQKKDTPPAIAEADPELPPENDLFVPLGNLTGKSIAHLREVLDRGDPQVLRNYEELTEDFIQTFNHAVTQGVPVEWVLFSFTQAFAITMGQCLRAGLSYPEAAKFLKVIMDNARMSKDLVQQVTLLTPTTSGTKQ